MKKKLRKLMEGLVSSIETQYPFLSEAEQKNLLEDFIYNSLLEAGSQKLFYANPSSKLTGDRAEYDIKTSPRLLKNKDFKRYLQATDKTIGSSPTDDLVQYARNKHRLDWSSKRPYTGNDPFNLDSRRVLKMPAAMYKKIYNNPSTKQSTTALSYLDPRGYEDLNTPFSEGYLYKKDRRKVNKNR